jgi:hypothetical protein
LGCVITSPKEPVFFLINLSIKRNIVAEGEEKKEK